MRDLRHFLRERQQRITFGAAHPAPGVFTEKEHQKGENQAEADGESERDNRHDGGRGAAAV